MLPASAWLASQACRLSLACILRSNFLQLMPQVCSVAGLFGDQELELYSLCP